MTPRGMLLFMAIGGGTRPRKFVISALLWQTDRDGVAFGRRSALTRVRKTDPPKGDDDKYRKKKNSRLRIVRRIQVV